MFPGLRKVSQPVLRQFLVGLMPPDRDTFEDLLKHHDSVCEFNVRNRSVSVTVDFGHKTVKLSFISIDNVSGRVSTEFFNRSFPCG